MQQERLVAARCGTSAEHRPSDAARVPCCDSRLCASASIQNDITRHAWELVLSVAVGTLAAY
eukprot:6209775-Pleurochrysis_carterae.AAC.2